MNINTIFSLIMGVITLIGCSNEIVVTEERVIGYDTINTNLNSLAAQNIYSVTQRGADNRGIEDCTEIIQSIVDDIYTKGYGTLYFPKGNYKVLGSISKSVTNANSSPIRLVIRGDREYSSIIECYSSKETFLFFSQNKSSQIHLYDLSFKALKSNCGTAFAYKFPAGGNLHNRSFLCDRVIIGDENKEYGFSKGIDLYGQWRSLVRNTTVIGQKSIPLSMEIGIDVSGGYTPRIEGCIVRNAQFGACYNAIDGEGGDFTNNRFEACNIGFFCSSVGVEPHLNFSSNRFDCLKKGLWIDARKFNYILYNEFANSYQIQSEYHDLYIESTHTNPNNGKPVIASNHLISLNTFERSLNNSRIMINLGPAISDIFIRENRYSGEGLFVNDPYSSSNLYIENNTTY